MSSERRPWRGNYRSSRKVSRIQGLQVFLRVCRQGGSRLTRYLTLIIPGLDKHVPVLVDRMAHHAYHHVDTGTLNHAETSPALTCPALACYRYPACHLEALPSSSDNEVCHLMALPSSVLHEVLALVAGLKYGEEHDEARMMEAQAQQGGGTVVEGLRLPAVRLACRGLQAAVDGANPLLVFGNAPGNPSGGRYTDAARLKRILGRSESLTHLTFARMQPGHCYSALAASLSQGLGWLKSLDLSNNALDISNLKVLLSALTSNSVIRRLNLSRNWAMGMALEPQLAPELMRQLASLIKVNTALQHLDLSGSWFPSPRVSIFRGLDTNTTLLQLDLRNCNLGAAAGSQLFSALKLNSTLQRLDLSNNDGDLLSSGHALMVDMLRVNTSLTHFAVNIPTEATSRNVAQALQHNRTLLHLELRRSHLCGAGVLAWAKALRVNTTLQHLDLGNYEDCNIAEAEVMELAEALQRNKTLLRLVFIRRSYGYPCEAGILAWARVVRVNNTLQHLDLGDCDIADDKVMELMKALATSTSLRYFGRLDLSRASYAARQLVLTAILRDHKSLSKICLTDLRWTNDVARAGEYGLAVLLGVQRV